MVREPADRAPLETHGLFDLASVNRNLSLPALYQHAVRRNEAIVAPGGALVVNTGEHTGRSPRDRFIVRTPGVDGTINWGAVNQPLEPRVFDDMHRRVAAHFANRDVFVQDCIAGADPSYGIRVRVVTERAWCALFSRNMFIRPPAGDAAGAEPDFTILHAPGLRARGQSDGLNSETFILIHLEKRLVLIGGTGYAGEIKKSIFGILNYLLPDRNVLPMHCSANVGPRGDAAVFFGLSGTGKTTLSADSSRMLIGDDEHGWSESGVFNFEGGCYAKVINLSAEAEPEIYATTSRFGTVLENVVFDPVTHELDFADNSLTENTRACYPLDYVGNTADGCGDHPRNVVMLTADAFGVLPPIARLSPEQAMYHFLSGYTARVAGTERGLGRQPEATFSTCFGAPFMPRQPTVYGEMLRHRIAEHGATCWLVNTGWSGGKAGDGGRRMPLGYTRAMVRAALDGVLETVPIREDRRFGLQVPEHCPDVPEEILQPRAAWHDKSRYDVTAADLCSRFIENFRSFESQVSETVRAAGARAV